MPIRLRNEAYSPWMSCPSNDTFPRVGLVVAALDDLFREGHGLGSGVAATVVLVETLLDRAAESDVVQAEAALERLAAAPADESLVMRDIWLLRLRALLARAHGDAARLWGDTQADTCQLGGDNPLRIPPPRPRKLLV